MVSSELSKNRVKYAHRLLNVGNEIVLRVLTVNPQNGFIFLSRKRVEPGESEKHKQRFIDLKRIESIMKLLSIRVEKPLIYLYENIVWPLNKIYFYNTYDNFKLIATGKIEILEKLKISAEIKNELFKILKSNLGKPIKIISNFKLSCYLFEGIDAIKESLLKGEKKSTEDISIKFKYIGSPIYQCICITTNKNLGIEKMNEALTEVKRTIEEKGGNFLLEKTPTICGRKKKKTNIFY